MARGKKSDDEAAADPTLGGAIPDPTDDSPRGRFNRGEIDAAELNRALAVEQPSPAGSDPDA